MNSHNPQFNPALGFAKLLWGDAIHDIPTTYPHAIRALPLHGKEPHAGERFVLPTTYIIEHIYELPPLSLTAHVIAHDDKIIGIDLFPRNKYAHGTLPPYIKVALDTLGQTLGVHIEAPGPQLQSWVVGDATVTLYFQGNDFMLSIIGPGVDATPFTTEAHRGYRRAQSQRCLTARPNKQKTSTNMPTTAGVPKPADQVDHVDQITPPQKSPNAVAASPKNTPRKL